MNNFTKEELEYIMHLWHVCNSYHSSPSQDFKDKLQSMIDNYCEHCWTSVGNHPWLHCIKCKRNFDYE